MQKNMLFVFQFLSIPFGLAVFYLFQSHFNRFDSFAFSMMAYWSFIAAAIFVVIRRDPDLGNAIIALLGPSTSIVLSLLSFVPVFGVFFVALLPVLSSIKPFMLFAALSIGFLNGIFEEVFWRGLTIASLKQTPRKLVGASVSIVFFALFHCSFLMLNLEYQGGAANLVGGAFIMGILWYYVAQRTGSIQYGILAHQAVNTFAFTSLFIFNGI